MITLRGYTITREDGRHYSVCVRPFLVTQGASQVDAHRQMVKLIDAYLEDAVADDALEARLNVRAPLSVLAQYWAAKCISVARLPRAVPFKQKTSVPAHA